jgi:hypothetical protein
LKIGSRSRENNRQSGSFALAAGNFHKLVAIGNTEYGIRWLAGGLGLKSMFSSGTRNPTRRATAERSARKGDESRAIALMQPASSFSDPVKGLGVLLCFSVSKIRRHDQIVAKLSVNDFEFIYQDA